MTLLLPPRPSWPRNRNRSTSTTIISSTTASAPPPPPPPPVSTTVVRSRSTSSRSESSAMETLPVQLLNWRNERTASTAVPAAGEWMKTGVAAIAGLLLVSACSQSAERQPSANSSQPAPAPAPVPPPGTGPDARTPLARPADAVDPKSSEGAVNLVQGFADLLNRHKYDEAYMLLGPGAPPRGDFDRQWAQLKALHV